MLVMTGIPFSRVGTLLTILILLFLAVPGSVAESVSFAAMPGDDVVLQWNDMTLDLIRSEMTGTQKASRTMAMVHSSMYDAINGIGGKYHPYPVTAAAPAGASAEAAGPLQHTASFLRYILLGRPR